MRYGAQGEDATHTHTHAHTHTHTHTHTKLTNTHTHTLTHTYTSLHPLTRTHTHTHTHTHRPGSHPYVSRFQMKGNTAAYELAVGMVLALDPRNAAALRETREIRAANAVRQVSRARDADGAAHRETGWKIAIC